MKRAKQQLFENNKHSVLVVDELTKKYGKFLAVDHVSFCVESNECFGVLGPNGAGKTSTFKVSIKNHCLKSKLINLLTEIKLFRC